MKAKHILVSVLVLAALLLAVSPAFAGILFNDDDQNHEIVFVRGVGRVEVKVESKKALRFECGRETCTITLKQTGQTLRVQDQSAQIFIENGRLVVRSPAPSADDREE